MRLRNLHLQKIFTTQPEKALSNPPWPRIEQGWIEGPSQPKLLYDHKILDGDLCSLLCLCKHEMSASAGQLPLKRVHLFSI